MAILVNKEPCHNQDGTRQELEPLPMVAGRNFTLNIQVTEEDAPAGAVYFLMAADDAPIRLDERNRRRTIKPEYEGNSRLRFFGKFEQPGDWELYLHGIDARRVATIPCHVMADVEDDEPKPPPIPHDDEADERDKSDFKAMTDDVPAGDALVPGNDKPDEDKAIDEPPTKRELTELEARNAEKKRALEEKKRLKKAKKEAVKLERKLKRAESGNSVLAEVIEIMAENPKGVAISGSITVGLLTIFLLVVVGLLPRACPSYTGPVNLATDAGVPDAAIVDQLDIRVGSPLIKLETQPKARADSPQPRESGNHQKSKPRRRKKPKPDKEKNAVLKALSE